MMEKPVRDYSRFYIFAISLYFYTVAGHIHAYSGGSGTEEDPYLISRLTDWQELTSETRQDKYFVLTTDLDFTSVVMRPVAPGSDGGYTDTPFSCIFDGGGHILRNIILNPTQNDHVGLFGNLGKKGVIQNLGVENVRVTGHVHVGGLCAYSEGTIRNCYATGTVTGVDYSQRLGGLCGMNYGTIENCYAVVTLIGAESPTNIGGLCGANGRSIRTCYASGMIQSGTHPGRVGGLCGDNFGTIVDCYWNRDSAGVSTSSGGWEMNQAQMKQAGTFLGWNNGQWTINGGQDFPRLAWQAAVGSPITTDYPERTYSGSGTDTEPFQLGTPDDIVCLGLRPVDWGKHFVLIDNIDMSGVADYRPPQNFRGILDGQRHVIRNLTIDATITGNRTKLGLVGHLDGEGRLANLGMEQVVILGVDDSHYLGGLCGDNYGWITNCYSTGIVGGGYASSDIGGLCGYSAFSYIRNCFSTSTVTGTDMVGGLCGDNNAYGEIRDCYASGDVRGLSRIGGLVGHNFGKVIHCYSRGTVLESPAGGGLCSESIPPNINESEDTGNFWDIQSSHTETSAMGTGMTTEAMQTFSTFVSADWDFVNTWRLPAGDYPRLRWEAESPLAYGSLQVTIVPSEAAVAGAQWRRVGTPDWFGSVQIAPSIPAGYWYVEFKAVEGWVPPETLRILISPDATTSVQASYRAVLFAYGSGTADDPFQIHTIDDWLTLLRDSKDWDKCFILNHDIDFGGKELTPVAPDTDAAGGFQGIPFAGKFDGDGHILRNVNMTLVGSVHVGLFGCLETGGTIRNLGVENIRISAFSRAGGLIGWNNGGTLTYCHATGFVTGGDSSFAIGGLCGRNDGTIINCYASMAIIAGAQSSYLGGLCGRSDAGTIKGSYARCSIVSGNYSSYLGGLCGYNSGTITDCYSSGTLRGDSSTGGLVGSNGSGTIQFCYSSTGVPLGYRLSGGLVGGNTSGTIQSSFWDISTSGSNQSAGGVGKTIPEMKTLTTFTTAGWDFVDEGSNGMADVWRMCGDSRRYPQLAWVTWPEGDFDCPDGVAMEDLLYVVERWMTTTPSGIGAADGNRDGSVSLDDFVSLSDHWMKTNPNQFLVGYWPLDGSLNPEAGTSRGYPIGSGLPTFVSSSSARIGSGAVNLSGTHFIEMFGYYGISGTHARTTMAWIKTTGTVGPIVYWGDNNTAGALWDMRVGSLGQLRLVMGGGPVVDSVTKVNTGQWIHVAAVLPEGGNSTNAVQLYVNGVRETEAVTAGTINTRVGAEFRIGANEGGTNFFTGLIDDVRVYDRALTAEEIAELAGQ